MQIGAWAFVALLGACTASTEGSQTPCPPCAANTNPAPSCPPAALMATDSAPQTPAPGSAHPSASPPPQAAPPAVVQPSPDEAAAAQGALSASATGPAVKGPRGTRPCEFRESVDSYRRSCVVKTNADGSLQVTAKGTELNPDNGFDFSLHGGPHNFVAKGELNAFGICRGPFVSQVHTVIDKGVTTYELRLREHCMIVIR